MYKMLTRVKVTDNVDNVDKYCHRVMPTYLFP